MARGAPKLILLALALSGCGSKGAASLTASIENAKLTVASVALGTKLSGSFDLRLSLGDYADSAVDVTPDKFSVVGADGTAIVPTLSASPGVQPPFHVGVGDAVTVAYTLDDANPLDVSTEVALCARQVLIAGSVSDSGGATSSANGSPFSVTGCK